MWSWWLTGKLVYMFNLQTSSAHSNLISSQVWNNCYVTWAKSLRPIGKADFDSFPFVLFSIWLLAVLAQERPTKDNEISDLAGTISVHIWTPQLKSEVIILVVFQGTPWVHCCFPHQNLLCVLGGEFGKQQSLIATFLMELQKWAHITTLRWCTPSMLGWSLNVQSSPVDSFHSAWVVLCVWFKAKREMTNFLDNKTFLTFPLGKGAFLISHVTPSSLLFALALPLKSDLLFCHKHQLSHEIIQSYKHSPVLCSRFSLGLTQTTVLGQLIRPEVQG